jgi:predicted dithiol-disulfide oxidoreductase (DUF899 family)
MWSCDRRKTSIKYIVMKIINVINLDTVKNDIISIESFGVFEEQESSDVQEEADDYLIDLAVELKFGDETNTTREDLETRNFFRDEVSEAIDENKKYQIGDNLLSVIYSYI